MADITRVAAMDPSLDNSPIAANSETESTVVLDSAATQCHWNGESFAEGARVECDDAVYECSFGRWSKI